MNEVIHLVRTHTVTAKHFLCITLYHWITAIMFDTVLMTKRYVDTVLQYVYLIILHAMPCVSSTYCTMANQLRNNSFLFVKVLVIALSNLSRQHLAEWLEEKQWPNASTKMNILDKHGCSAFEDGKYG